MPYLSHARRRRALLVCKTDAGAPPLTPLNLLYASQIKQASKAVLLGTVGAGALCMGASASELVDAATSSVDLTMALGGGAAIAGLGAALIATDPQKR